MVHLHKYALATEYLWMKNHFPWPVWFTKIAWYTEIVNGKIVICVNAQRDYPISRLLHTFRKHPQLHRIFFKCDFIQRCAISYGYLVMQFFPDIIHRNYASLHFGTCLYPFLSGLLQRLWCNPLLPGVVETTPKYTLRLYLNLVMIYLVS